jgi:hypothetical protein
MFMALQSKKNIKQNYLQKSIAAIWATAFLLVAYSCSQIETFVNRIWTAMIWQRISVSSNLPVLW